MIAIKANTIAEYEEINAELMKLFNLDVRYCGRENMPDIRLELGGFGIPLPKDKKQIELSSIWIGKNMKYYKAKKYERTSR